MNQKIKLLTGVLALLAVLGLVTATRAWYLDVSVTPPGEITSAVVRYLPEARQTPESLVTYGSLISGSSISTEGIPHVLPGDRLLASTSFTVSDNLAVRKVATSRAREFEEGETPGTVINMETRYYTDPQEGSRSITKTQRDLMNTEILPEVWKNKAGEVIPKPQIDNGQYDMVTAVAVETMTTTDSLGQTVDITDTILTTTYTHVDKEKGTVYYLIRDTKVTVIHEFATYSDSAIEWTTVPAYPSISAKETVLSVTNGVTRSQLEITQARAAESGDKSSAATALPLSIGNLSTVETNVRLGVSAVLLSGGNPEQLELRLINNTYYLGKTDGNGRFVELLLFRLGGDGSYSWSRCSGTSDYLWDLALTDSGTAIPPVSSVEGLEAEPVLYTAMKSLQVATKSDFLLQADFEEAFNQLYCNNSPKIQLHIRFYAKQGDYMAWSEFRSESITMQF